MRRCAVSLILVAQILWLLGCGQGRFSTDLREGRGPSEFVPAADHLYFPMAPGQIWLYEGEEEGMRLREEVRILPEVRTIANAPCTAVHQQVFLDDVLVEVTLEWYAQDRQGNLWKFGEESWDREAGRFVASEDSWTADGAGVLPWMVLAALPAVGDLYRGGPPGDEDALLVVSLSETAVVPAGVFLGCMELREVAPEGEDEEDEDIILYAPGVGPVAERSADGYLHLVWRGP